MLAEIWAALRAIPELIGLIKALMGWLKSVFGDDPKKFLKDASEVFAELSQAKTPEAKIEAAKKIQNLITRL